MVRTSSSSDVIGWPLSEEVTKIVQKLQFADEATIQTVAAILAEPHPIAIDGTDDWQEIAKAYKHPLFLAADRLVTEVNEQWAARMAHGMLNSDNTVDQREIDFRRGWYRGARYALRVLPFRANRRLQKQLAEDEEVATPDV